MTQSQLAAISVLTKIELHAVVRDQSIDAVLRLRREVQEAIVQRRKRISLEQSRMDPYLLGGMGVMMQLERWARQAAYTQMMPDILRRDPGLLLKGKSAAKIQFKQEWEKYISRMSY